MGNKIENSFSGIFKDRDASLCDVYCEHLRNHGVQAFLLDKESPEQIHYSILDLPGKKLGSIKIEGKNFQQLILWRGDGGRGGPNYYQHYLVHAMVGDNKGELSARGSIPITSIIFHSKEDSRNFIWKGGLLAESLNSDLDLQERIKRSPHVILVTPLKKIPYAYISIQHLDRDDYPSPHLLDIIDRIANHIRRMAPPSL